MLRSHRRTITYCFRLHNGPTRFGGRIYRTRSLESLLVRFLTPCLVKVKTSLEAHTSSGIDTLCRLALMLLDGRAVTEDVLINSSGTSHNAAPPAKSANSDLTNINYDFGSERSKYCTTLLYPHGLIFYTTSELDYRR